LILWVEDASMPSNWAVDVADRLNGKPTILVSNKIDRVQANITVRDVYAKSLQVETSATLGIGIDELRQAISKALVPEVPSAGSPIPVTMRQVEWLKSVADRRGSLRDP